MKCPQCGKYLKGSGLVIETHRPDAVKVKVNSVNNRAVNNLDTICYASGKPHPDLTLSNLLRTDRSDGMFGRKQRVDSEEK